MTEGARRKRLLWNEPIAVAFCGMALLVTVAIAALQTSRRKGIIDPESVGIFERLFHFGDIQPQLAGVHPV